MDLMVNPQITGFRQDVDGTIKELKLGEAKEDAWANIAEQGASAKLQEKEITIDVSAYSGTPVITRADKGYDGLKFVVASLSNIPSGTTSVTFYAWATADAPTSTRGLTLSETPSVNDNVFRTDRDGNPSHSSGDIDVIVAVGENTITIENGEDTLVLTRLSDGDITFPKSSS